MIRTTAGKLYGGKWLQSVQGRSIIRPHEYPTPKQARREFKQLAVLLSGRLIVHILVYADESGTHDLTAKEPGSHVAVIAGYFGLADDWVEFCGQWEAVLNKYKVPVFHFSEFASKAHCSRPKSPYFGWSEQRRNDFLMGLARIAGDRKRYFFAPSLNLEVYNRAENNDALWTMLVSRGFPTSSVRKRRSNESVIYTGLFHEFFHTFVGELDFVIPDFNEPIRFVFDRKDGDSVWNISAHQMFDLFAKMDSRFTAISFDDKKKSLPLQAADMLAYRLHQIRENERNTKGDHVFTALDYALMAGGRTHDEFMAWRNGLLADNAKRRNGRT